MKIKPDLYESWAKLVASMCLPKRDPMWQKAIGVMIVEGVIDPTMRFTLPFEDMEEIIFDKGIEGEVSIYDILTDLAKWMNADDNIANYLSRYFTNGADVMLAYLMATQYGLFWDGDENIMAWEAP